MDVYSFESFTLVIDTDDVIPHSEYESHPFAHPRFWVGVQYRNALLAEIKVEDKKIKFRIDCGATVCVLQN